MKTNKFVLMLVLAVTAAYPQARPASENAEARIAKAARHEILTLPYFDVFDYIELRINGYNVTLIGQVRKPALKSDAERVVKEIEGVEAVDNQIEVLPFSPNDDRVRMASYRAIYGYPALQRYAMPVVKPIRIIVKNGNLTLEGVVDSEGDSNLVGMRANGVHGAFSVTNHLRIEK